MVAGIVKKQAKLETEKEERLLLSILRRWPGNTHLLRQVHARAITCLATSPLSILHRILSLSLAGGDTPYARKVFSQLPIPKILTLNTIIKAFSDARSPQSVPFYLFKLLVARTRPRPNGYTVSFVLKGCSITSDLKEGRQVHSHALRRGLSSDAFVQTALVNFYSKCGEIECAEQMFDEIPERNVVSWSAMISGYVGTGMINQAFDTFREMQLFGVVPDAVTMVSVISACAASGASEIGRWVHTYLSKMGIMDDIELNTALVNMYSKCGLIEKAAEVFNQMPIKDTKTWSSMIMGFALHGFAEEALEAFSKMESAKVKPNHVTFIAILSACAHGGLVSQGRKYWSAMSSYGIEPSMELYGCMVDMLIRANQLEEAFVFVDSMPITPNPVIWRTLLTGCRKSKYIERGEIIAQRLLELEPTNAGNYILLCNLYASGAKWEKFRSLREKMKEMNINTVVSPGCSSVEVDFSIHEFFMGDGSHPEANEIRNTLKEIRQKVAQTGYKPQLSAVMREVDDVVKEDDLFQHSERLAIAFGLMKTKAPAVIRIVKNLRVCPDCHEVTKIISKIYGREIVVRDRVRFHRFVNGECSCKDYW